MRSAAAAPADGTHRRRQPRQRAIAGEWHHLRSEWLPLGDGELRVSTWTDGRVFQRVEVPRPGRPQDRLNLRVILAEVEVACVRVSRLHAPR